LRYFFSQFHDAVFNGILHDDRLAERKAPESIQIWSSRRVRKERKVA
jgi:hypothetical protein